ncbi:MAG: argininosuccinate synthase [Candidatus Omnitrophica bacterium]|nr:argininosuccinate synthase [Candidatus Omnitrophota bacterium]
MKKVILAYSGGLDTSVAIKWLKDKGFEVICCMVDMGQVKDFSAAKKKAVKIGASKVYIIDASDEFVNDYIFPALKANAAYEDKYFLATALSRPLIAEKLVEIAKKEKAQFIAHGCTGKGNDQVRLEASSLILGKDLKIIAPLREWNFASRESEIKYAKMHNIPVEATKKSPYSLDVNLWGISIECGVLEDPAVEPPEDAYQITKSPKDAPNTPAYVKIEFKKGIPVAINNKKYSGIGLINKLTDIGAKHGVGRSDMVENRLVGIKSREIYEAPAATILHAAHKELEALVLDRELLHFKKGIEQKYSELVYYGLWHSPLKSALDSFINKTQDKVSGEVTLKLYKGSCSVVSRKSPHSLYSEELATYSSKDKFDKKLAEGFIKIWAMPYKSR